MVVDTLKVTLHVEIVRFDYLQELVNCSDSVALFEKDLEDELLLVENNAERFLVLIQEFKDLIEIPLGKENFNIELYKVLRQRLTRSLSRLPLLF